MGKERTAHSYLRPRHTGFWWLCLVSAVVHVGVIAWFGVASAKRRPTIDLTERVTVVKMVKLGKKRDPKMLPRIEKAPAPPKQEETALALDKPLPEKVEQEPPREDPDQKKTDAMQKIEEMARRQAALDRIAEQVGDEEPEGDPEGSASGTEARGNLAQNYYGQLHDRIKAFFTVPTIINEAERRTLRAVLTIYVAADGVILRHEVNKGSGNEAFDSALESAIQRASPLPAPPAFLQETLRDGIDLRFTP